MRNWRDTPARSDLFELPAFACRPPRYTAGLLLAATRALRALGYGFAGLMSAFAARLIFAQGR
jgi:hypothetical protein